MFVVCWQTQVISPTVIQNGIIDPAGLFIDFFFIIGTHLY